PAKTGAALARRDEDAAQASDRAVAADEEWRRLTGEVEGFRAERRQIHSERRGKPSPAEIEEARRARESLGEMERRLREAEERRREAMAWVPNLPDESVPLGKDDTENEIIRVVGQQH